MKNLSTGHAFNLDQMLIKFPYDKLKGLKGLNKSQKKSLIKKIIKDSVYMVLNDIIDDNAQFELPVKAKKAYMFMKRVSGDDFVKARKNGAFKGVDFLESDFTGNNIILQLRGNSVEGRWKETKVYVSGELKNKIIENTNKGKQYC